MPLRWCRTCGTRSPAVALEVASCRRLEGAGDAADMLLVALGAITLGYGPNSHENEAELLSELDLRDVEPGPAT